ncbi:MAG: hypothetical protein DSZ08_02080 [Sulfurovum sp.]|nr:MAG: hypothetical protein DSZ08_02080 [Sulfurovum sp.]
MIYAYMRQTPNLENLATQKNNILTFSYQKNMNIEKEVVEYATKDLVIEERKEFENFLESLHENKYTVVVSSLSVLSTRVEELVKIIHCMLSHHVDLWVCDTPLLINEQSSIVDIFPRLDQLRKKPKEKIHIGRPKGSKSSSKFDKYHHEIMTLLSDNQSVSAIARELDVSRSSLKDYIESRALKTLVTSIGDVAEVLEDKKTDNIVLICPFKADKLNKTKVK